MGTLLTAQEINQELEKLKDWKLEGKSIKLLKTFSNFVEAIDFVNKLVAPAEKANHHPDLEISYNKVWITLTTHDVGGLTKKDFELAQIISQIR